MLLSKNIRCIVSDVDDTLAYTYGKIDDNLTHLLEKLLISDVKMLLISGSNIKSIFERVVCHIKPELRRNVFVGHCNGAETFSFFGNGQPQKIEKHTIESLKAFNIPSTENLIRDYLIRRNILFGMPNEENRPEDTPNHIYAVLENSGVQLSIDFAYTGDNPDFDMKQYRDKFSEDIKKVISSAGIDCEVKRGGLNAIDFAPSGTNKGHPIKEVIMVTDNESEQLSESNILINNISEVEVWGDSFLGGSDFDMCTALPDNVKKISFRKIPLSSELRENNVQIWDGEHELHDGVLEYLTNSLCAVVG